MRSIPVDLMHERLAACFDGYIAHQRSPLGIPDDWKYRGLPFMKEEYYNHFILIVGFENIKIVSGSMRTIAGEVYIRNSMFISPDGMKRIEIYNDGRSQESAGVSELTKGVANVTPIRRTS